MGIGDEIMVTGHARELQKADARRVRVVYERSWLPRWDPIWDNNPRLARFGEEGNFQKFYPRTNGLRPYCIEKSVERWMWKEYGPPVGEIYLTKVEHRFADVHGATGSIVIGPDLKRKASPNKDWGRDRWMELVRLLLAKGFRPVHLGPIHTPPLWGCRRVVTNTFREAASFLANARAAIVGEGALHHAAAALGVPTVVIYGGYISPLVTGYPSQRNMFRSSEEHPLGCGWRKPCEHCAAAMSSITPEEVLTNLEEALRVPISGNLAT